MRFTSKNIYFNEEERWISGVDESVPMAKANLTLSQVLQARHHCRKGLISLLVEDIDARGAEEERALVDAHINRLDQIDQFAQRLVTVVAPLIVSQLQSHRSQLETTVEEEARR